MYAAPTVLSPQGAAQSLKALKNCSAHYVTASDTEHYFHDEQSLTKVSTVSNDHHPLQIVLYEPEIPPNTGNIIRLCANTGVGLHLIEPLGFSLDSKALRRAGLDYHEYAQLQVHASLGDCLDQLLAEYPQRRVFAMTTKGSTAYHQKSYGRGDVLLFGPETRGLPDGVLQDDRVSDLIRIPMRKDSRSLNLSNTAAIVTYEALRQLDFSDMA